MVIDNVIINKSIAIERCLSRIREERGGIQLWLIPELAKQDSVILNLQRACELSVDLATHVVKKKKLGIIQSSRDGFDLLSSAGLLDAALADAFKRMVGFRSIAIHEYQKLDLRIVDSIVENQLKDFTALIEAVKAA